MILLPFEATLNAPLTADSQYLTISTADMSRLLAQVPAGESTLLVIRDGVYSEEVLATNQDGTIILTRGQGNTTARKFPYGSYVCFQVTVSVVRYIMCNEDCCEGGCPCEPIDVVGSIAPAGTVGDAYNASVIFMGTAPMTFGVTGQPEWIEVDAGANYVRLYGTPTGEGEWAIAVSGTNCSGTAIAQDIINVSISG